MVDGHTDAVIASRLGMSVRSVTNHVRWASDLFGSRSRAQLAYQIGRSGFLGDETTDTAPGRGGNDSCGVAGGSVPGEAVTGDEGP
ncbi:hypothetical protein RFN57_35340 [Streptomyces violaceochromogenes]|uniref:HTH luxR-type domain-containing protein n=1 Tax=Streptomyces violaceochromogenes TaxID=67377 RepID=A0ABU6MAT5_9ACTN|nr:hypothetical protein [Streptomyces violaceochromogenes]MEC7057521.1 hypothetical protein [Streptomyces violaceochromogenes]